HYGFFEDVDDLTSVVINEQTIVLCHYAMSTFDRGHRNAIQLYGHSHSEAEAWLDEHMPGRRSMDVGVDNIKKLFGEYRPISFDEIMAIMKDRPGFTIGCPSNLKTSTEEEILKN